MKTKKHFKVASIIVLSLGIIHLCATPVVFSFFKANNHLNPASIYMFIMVGISTVFIGWLQYFILKKMDNENVFRTILSVSVFLVSLAGIGAVATMWHNPFAYIILLVALYEVTLMKIFKDIVVS